MATSSTPAATQFLELLRGLNREHTAAGPSHAPLAEEEEAEDGDAWWSQQDRAGPSPPPAKRPCVEEPSRQWGWGGGGGGGDAWAAERRSAHHASVANDPTYNAYGTYDTYGVTDAYAQKQWIPSNVPSHVPSSFPADVSTYDLLFNPATAAAAAAAATATAASSHAHSSLPPSNRSTYDPLARIAKTTTAPASQRACAEKSAGGLAPGGSAAPRRPAAPAVGAFLATALPTATAILGERSAHDTGGAAASAPASAAASGRPNDLLRLVYLPRDRPVRRGAPPFSRFLAWRASTMRERGGEYAALMARWGWSRCICQVISTEVRFDARKKASKVPSGLRQRMLDR